MKKPFVISLTLTAVLSGVFVYLLTFALVPPTSWTTTPIFEIPHGAGLQDVARRLKDNGFIRNERAFVAVCKLLGAERNLQAGEYEFRSGMSPFEIIRMLRHGKVRLHELTIPEGYNSFQIASLLNEKSLVPYSDFMKLATDAVFVRSLGIKADSIEGFLYPETYFFPKGMAAADILRVMVKTFEERYTSQMEERAKVLSMTRREVITLASIIEKETSVENERSIVSAVFHNRLKKRMLLQSDPTVIYAISDFDGNIRRRDLSIHSPYNTYRVVGLPPGPIANPSQASIHAALYPADVGFLYFVSKNNGTHHFSRTLSEHNRAVEDYQKRRVKSRDRR